MKTKLYSFVAVACLLFIFSCQKEFSIEDSIKPGTSSGTAKFSYAGAPGNCTNPVITGSFTAGAILDITNTITVQVNVTDTGSYTITSSSVNGMTFFAAGYFTLTGQQSAVFYATGTPSAGGAFDFTLGNAGCSVQIVCTGSSTPPSNNSNCKACSYVPLCVGSKYTYNDSTYGTASIRAIDLLTTADTTIGSKIHQKITASNGVAYYNCTNGETSVVGYALVSNTGNTLQKYQSTMLKANAAVGSSWSDSLQNPTGQTVIQKFTIISKGTSKAIGGFNFTDIIVVSLETGIDVPGFGFLSASLSHYSYAKGVGLVEVVTEDPFLGQVFYHSVIKSYFIP